MAMLARVLLLFVILVTSHAFALGQVEVRIDLIPKEGFSDSGEASKRAGDRIVVLSISNITMNSIEVPQSYSPDVIRVCASGSAGTRWPLVLFQHVDRGDGYGGATPERFDTKLNLISLGPGEKHEVLRVDANETLYTPGDMYTLNPKKEFTERRWVWGWTAHPGPDYSPFEKRKGDKRSHAAVLWGEFDIDGQTLRSIPILINADWKGGG